MSFLSSSVFFTFALTSTKLNLHAHVLCADGIGGDANINNRGRFIALTKVDASTSLRDLFGGNAKDGHLTIRAEAVYGTNLPAAFRAASWRAISVFGNDANLPSSPRGSLASLPELMRARTTAAFENDVWTARFTGNSEQSIVKNQTSGEHFVITVHGGGVLSSSERIERSFRMDESSLTGQVGPVLSISISSL